jgi:4-hydroxy-tetrahydrodipicolinate reductase
MRIALIGYGKMGRMIEGLAPEYGVEVAGQVDSPSDPLPDNFDVAIDFSEPAVVVANVRRVADAGKNLVIGTTGWADRLGEVQQIVDAAGIGAVYSANFSIGVNVFLNVVERAAELMARYPEYEAWAYEVHHSAKKDAPSGTLLQLTEAMRTAGYVRNIDVASNRVGRVPGTHTIGFDSAADTITLTHTARSREGFARGALLAAKLVQGKSGLLRFSDLLAES